MQQMKILVLGPEGSGRSALEETLFRLGNVVVAAEAHAHEAPPSGGDIVMLDLREGEPDWRELAEGLRADARPMVIVSERPQDLVRSLLQRRAGTMLLSGAESDAGYTVALAVCRGLAMRALPRPRFATLARVAAPQ